MEIWEYKLNRLLEFLPTLGGVFAVTAGVLLLALSFMRADVRWFCLVIFLWCATIFEPVQVEMGFHELFWPLSAIRDSNVLIGTAMLMVLVLPALVADRGWRHTVVAPPLIAYFIFQLIFCLHDAFQDESKKAFFQIVLFSLQFTVLAVGLGKWLQNDRDLRRLIWALAIAASLFCIACTIQAAINHNAMIHNRRFMGTTGNAQHAGQIIGITIPVLCYVLATKMGGRLVRIGVVLVLGLMCLYLAWTGSRTALLIGGTGTIMLFRFRLGRLALVAAGAVVAVALAASIFGENVEEAGRLLDTTDTRSVAWRTMFGYFAANPILGTPRDEAMKSYSENSYLLTAAERGLIGLIPLLITVVLLIRQARQLKVVRRTLPQYALLADLISGCFTAALIGAFFDGFLLGQFNLIVFSIFLMSTAGAYLQDLVAVTQSTAAEPWQEHDLRHAQVGYYY